jgi:pimeloyl-ACP methyl ester carboxylesterase
VLPFCISGPKRLVSYIKRNIICETTERKRFFLQAIEPKPGRAADVAYLRRPGGGAAPPLVLLHGVGSNAQSFLPLMAALPATLDVIAWNAPGYADSAALPNASPVPADYARALADMLDALGLRRVTLVGHSLGALFAASFTARYADRVAALALMSPALGYRCPAGAALPATVQSRIDEILELGPAAFAAKRAARLVGDPQGKPQVVAAVERAMASVRPDGYVQAVRALGAGDLRADAAQISAPALVAVGLQDQITPPATARAAYEALHQRARYHEIDRAGHALPQEQPDMTAKILAELIEQAKP